MRILYSVFVIMTIIACEKDSISYPKIYSFSHLDQSEEGLFVLNSPLSADQINSNTGIYGANLDLFKSESEDFLKAIFELKEIDLISENTARIRYISDEVEYDTTVSYSVNEKQVIIEFLQGTDLIYHDSQKDEFVLCGFSLVALPGPNVINPGPEYNTLILEDCQEEADINEHLSYVLGQNSYITLDTLGILISKFIFR